jgi:hypothetical protein
VPPTVRRSALRLGSNGWRRFWSLSPPALGKGGDRVLAGRGIAVRWRAILVESERAALGPSLDPEAPLNGRRGAVINHGYSELEFFRAGNHGCLPPRTYSRGGELLLPVKIAFNFIAVGQGKSRTLRNHALLIGPPRWVLKTYRLRRSGRGEIVWNDFHFALGKK